LLVLPNANSLANAICFAVRFTSEPLAPWSNVSIGICSSPSLICALVNLAILNNRFFNFRSLIFAALFHVKHATTWGTSEEYTIAGKMYSTLKPSRTPYKRFSLVAIAEPRAKQWLIFYCFTWNNNHCLRVFPIRVFISLQGCNRRTESNSCNTSIFVNHVQE
jgi:hypothetical protein